jgi:hypothetical protein
MINYEMGFQIEFSSEEDKQNFFENFKKQKERSDLIMEFTILQSLFVVDPRKDKIKKQFKRFCSLGKYEIARNYLKKLKEL